MLRPLVFLVTLAVRAVRAVFCSREELLLENLALRQQVAALKKERPRRYYQVKGNVPRSIWQSGMIPRFWAAKRPVDSQKITRIALRVGGFRNPVC
jgi:hypothetical protein